MQQTKKEFEWVPVDVARRIAAWDGAMDEKRNDGAGNAGQGPISPEAEKPERTWNGSPRRPWQELARAIAVESDPIKIGELCTQLNAALSEEEKRRSRGGTARLPDVDGTQRTAS